MKGEWFASCRYTFRDREAKEEADVAIEVIKTFELAHGLDRTAFDEAEDAHKIFTFNPNAWHAVTSFLLAFWRPTPRIPQREALASTY
jgi:hypothetical protein